MEAPLHFISPKNLYVTKELLYHQKTFISPISFISPIKLLYHQTIFTKNFVALNKIFSTKFMIIRNNWAHTFKGTASGGFAPSPFENFFNPSYNQSLVEAGFVGGGSGVLSADQRLWDNKSHFSETLDKKVFFVLVHFSFPFPYFFLFCLSSDSGTCPQCPPPLRTLLGEGIKFK